MTFKKNFLSQFLIKEDDFKKSNICIDNLESIYNDYIKKHSTFKAAGQSIIDMLSEISNVHSFKMRIKAPYHLIEKIYRKNNVGITLDNYSSMITDLIGIRALHLFKEDWVQIHDFIIDTWKVHEKPTAMIRHGDSEIIFKDNNCAVKVHDIGYRSVHYLVKTAPSKEELIAEIQVRTVFEEAWSEIDHLIRYPYETEDPLRKDFLILFNRIAGTADEMGSYIKAYSEKERIICENKIKLIAEVKANVQKFHGDNKSKEVINRALNEILRLSHNSIAEE